MSSFKSFDDPREIKRRMNELGIDDFVPNSFPRVESQSEAFPVQLTEYQADLVYVPARQQAIIADLAFHVQLTEYQAADLVYKPAKQQVQLTPAEDLALRGLDNSKPKQQAKIADLLEGALTLEQIRLLSARQS